MLRLKEVTPMNSGIFLSLVQYNPPWDYDNNLLNIEYNLNYSGDKYISPLVENFLVDGKITEDGYNTLASILNTLYMSKWTKLYRTLNFDYNPIHNYDMEETGEHIIDNTSNDDLSENNTNQMTDTRTMNDTNENKVSAFNSTEYQDNSISVVDNTTQTTSTNTNQNTSSRDYKSNEEKTYKINRKGNIGVTTTQQMINAEREINMWNYFKTIFNDIDDVLTIKYYGGI